MKNYKQFLGSPSFWLGLQYSVSIVFSLITLKLNLAYFNASVMGVWFSINAIFGMFYVIDCGTNVSSVVRIATALKNQHINDTGRSFTAQLFLLTLLGLLLTIAGFITVLLLDTKMSYSAVLTEKTFKTVLVIFAVTGYIQYVSQALRSFLEGFSLYVVLSRINIAMNIFTSLGVILVVYNRLSIEFLAVATCIVPLCGTFSYLVFFLYIRFKHRIPLLAFQMNDLKELVTVGLPMQFSTIFGMWMDPIIKFAIGNFLSFRDVSYYEISRRFTTAFSGLFSTAFKTLLPQSSGISTKEAMSEFIDGPLQKVNRFAVGYAGAFFGISAIFVYLLMRYWFSSEAAFGVYLLILVPEIISILFITYYALLMGSGNTKVVARMQFLNLTTMIAACAVGFGIFKSFWGLAGYAFSVIAGNIYMTFFYRNTFKIDLMACLIKTNAVPVGLLAVTAIIGAIITRMGFGLQAAFGVSLFASVLFCKPIMDSIKIMLNRPVLFR